MYPVKPGVFRVGDFFYSLVRRHRSQDQKVMDASRIRAALSDLERELERARGAKTQIENEATGRPTEGGSYEEPKAALGSILKGMYEVLLVVLEAAGLPNTRSLFFKDRAHIEISTLSLHDALPI